jgi:hypothetical protein
MVNNYRNAIEKIKMFTALIFCRSTLNALKVSHSLQGVGTTRMTHPKIGTFEHFVQWLKAQKPVNHSIYRLLLLFVITNGGEGGFRTHLNKALQIN